MMTSFHHNLSSQVFIDLAILLSVPVGLWNLQLYNIVLYALG